MSEILCERTTSEGQVVRIRRLTPDGAVPVRAVIELDRRADTPRWWAGRSRPPALALVEGDSEPCVVASLLPIMHDDASVARLVARHGVR